MKKAILLIAVLLLVGSFVFAQDAGVKIGAWGRGIFTVAQSGQDTLDATKMGIFSQDQVSWGGVPRVGFTISGNSANVGFQADLKADQGAGVGFGDQQKIWVKPIDMLTVQVGVLQDNTLRGDAGAYGAFNWIRYSTISGEDNVFARVRANAELSIAPIEGLYAYAAFSGLTGGETVRRMLAMSQYGAGYTIPNIGVVRAQSFGQDTNTLEYSVINVAFKLTAVQNLTADIGAFIPTDSDLFGATAKAAAQFNYNLDVLKLMANVNVTIPKSGDTPLEIGVGAEYGLGDGLAVQGDFRWANAAMVGGTTFIGGEAAGMVGITKGFSNGLVGLGVELTDTSFSGAPAQVANGIAWAVPIRLEYWF